MDVLQLFDHSECLLYIKSSYMYRMWPTMFAWLKKNTGVCNTQKPGVCLLKNVHFLFILILCFFLVYLDPMLFLVYLDPMLFLFILILCFLFILIPCFFLFILIPSFSCLSWSHAPSCLSWSYAFFFLFILTPCFSYLSWTYAFLLCLDPMLFLFILIPCFLLFISIPCPMNKLLSCNAEVTVDDDSKLSLLSSCLMSQSYVEVSCSIRLLMRLVILSVSPAYCNAQFDSISFYKEPSEDLDQLWLAKSHHRSHATLLSGNTPLKRQQTSPASSQTSYSL